MPPNSRERASIPGVLVRAVTYDDDDASVQIRSNLSQPTSFLGPAGGVLAGWEREATATAGKHPVGQAGSAASVGRAWEGGWGWRVLPALTPTLYADVSVISNH